MAIPSPRSKNDLLYNELVSILGADNVSNTPSDRIVYSRDLWPMTMIWLKYGEFPYQPDVIVWPETTGQLQKILHLANREGIPVTPFAGGAGVCGGTIPHHLGLIIDMKKFDRILAIDEKAMTVTAQACVNGQDLEDELNRHGYTMGHFPSSIYCSMLGGFIATRSAGQLSTKYGNIEDMVMAMEVVLPTGEVVRTKPVPRCATGPSINQLMIGSEGTLGIITEATLKIHSLPEKRWMRGYVFQSVHHGLEGIRKVMRKGLKPAVVRLYDETDTAIQVAHLGFDAAGCLLIISFEGCSELVDLEAKLAHEMFMKEQAIDLGEKPGEHWWKTRYHISYRQAELFKDGGIIDTIEVAHTWSGIENLYNKMKEAMEGENAMVLAHFSHAYPQGINIYFSILTEGRKGEEPQVYYRLWDAAMRACVDAGGTISHHHGIGMNRVRWMAAEHGPGMKILHQLKQALDPNNIMNPGKLGMEGG